MLELRPVDSWVGVSPRPRVLLPRQWVKFSTKFPSPLEHVSGKTMQIVKNVQVAYPLSWILKESRYFDVNFSNDIGAELLYPDNAENLYEVLIGMEPGNYFAIPYFPADQPIYRLDYSTMTPTLTDAKLRYLGIVRPQDTPPGNPILRFYFVYRLKPCYLRLIADDGVDYEKVTLQLTVNRCQMEQGTPPSDVSPKYIEYLDSLRW
ncbi:MAG: hypothetical protein Q8O76_11765 [Chloroflexota bacterium]|nr:hypothetical protein [Chloroflexota bacterium]